MSVPAISVVLPVRDGARHLREALASLRAQTFADFELLVVDDGSRDATPEILEACARDEPRLRVLRQEPAGVAAALRAGCARARAPYVARLDADDVALPARLARQRAFLEAHPEVGVLGTGIEVIDESGRALRTWAAAEDHASAAEQLLFRPPVAHPTVMLRRALLERVGGYDPAFEGAEDYELWTRLVEVTRFANLKDPLVRYRRHAQSVTSREGGARMRDATLRARAAFMTRLLGRAPDADQCQWLERLERGSRRLRRDERARASELWDELRRAVRSRPLATL